mmetsp:Transcript_17446/g.39911  ORF Transcript_17446/g.39911 Transcript_17446/m.39911 type:complete len:216 (-) Transcript_17446:815-1462(-)
MVSVCAERDKFAKAQRRNLLLGDNVGQLVREADVQRLAGADGGWWRPGPPNWRRRKWRERWSRRKGRHRRLECAHVKLGVAPVPGEQRGAVQLDASLLRPRLALFARGRLVNVEHREGPTEAGVREHVEHMYTEMYTACFDRVHSTFCIPTVATIEWLWLWVHEPVRALGFHLARPKVSVPCKPTTVDAPLDVESNTGGRHIQNADDRVASGRRR